MARRISVIGWVLILVSLFCGIWAFNTTARSYPHTDGTPHYENIGRHEFPILMRKKNSGEADLQTMAVSFQLDDWNRGTPGTEFTRKMSTAPIQIHGAPQEWVNAISVGVFSTLAGLALMFASGTRLSWM